MKKLIKDLKTQGFKVGLYSSAGDYTQGNGKTKQTNPGSYGYEDADAYLFNSWGIDYLEYGEG
jgi:alpha-galactosidase